MFDKKMNQMLKERGGGAPDNAFESGVRPKSNTSYVSDVKAGRATEREPLMFNGPVMKASNKRDNIWMYVLLGVYKKGGRWLRGASSVQWL